MELLGWFLVVVLFVTLFTVLFNTSHKFVFIVKFAYLYCSYMVMGIVVGIICLPWPRNTKNGAMSAKIMKHINRVVGVEWVLEGAEHLKIESGAVVVMNHQSSVDVMAMCEIWPVLNQAAPIAKKSLLYAGPFGLSCWLLGTVFIDRTSKSSREDVNRAGAEAMKDGTKLMIFPEGTRNGAKNLSMLPFKKGAFHVALGAKMPILPVVISEYDFLDTRKMVFNSGQAIIRVLPPIETASYTKESIDDLIELTRSQMLSTLKQLSTYSQQEKKVS